MTNVTSFRVTGDWRHIVDDGMTDPDAEPDHAYPSGHVLFEAIDPDVAQAGDPALAYTLASVTAPIVKGILVDNEDREGIWLAGLIGDTPVTWRATTHLEYAGQTLDYPVLEFELVRDTHITGIEPHDGGYRLSTTAAPADVVSHPVTGDWRHIVDDGMVDLDALPDEALPTGKVTFHPVWPAVATAGDPAVAYTFATVTALVAAGELRDLQGRSGVWLAARVGVTPIQWRAVTEVEFQGQKIKLPPVDLVLDGPARLTSLYRDSTVWPAPVVTAVEGHRRAAEDAADRAEVAANEFGLTATSSTLAPGSQATVTVSGEGPAYAVEFGIPDPVWAGTADDLPATGTPGVLYAIFEE
ncbi:hypothetical protein M3B38_01680 [Dietzia cinnamea]|uniref:hypothetical protein n=1 Tax=Dietzia cinnamea TaxID=321318 RepID=UPI0021A8EFCD|nr:hypothetical protein [Dietzia cinnamea]MCT1710700.1 hypothetical protein [Dietzia cinnamea]